MPKCFMVRRKPRAPPPFNRPIVHINRIPSRNNPDNSRATEDPMQERINPIVSDIDERENDPVEFEADEGPNQDPDDDSPDSEWVEWMMGPDIRELLMSEMPERTENVPQVVRAISREDPDNARESDDLMNLGVNPVPDNDRTVPDNDGTQNDTGEPELSGSGEPMIVEEDPDNSPIPQELIDILMNLVVPDFDENDTAEPQMAGNISHVTFSDVTEEEGSDSGNSCDFIEMMNMNVQVVPDLTQEEIEMADNVSSGATEALLPDNSRYSEELMNQQVNQVVPDIDRTKETRHNLK